METDAGISKHPVSVWWVSMVECSGPLLLDCF